MPNDRKLGRPLGFHRSDALNAAMFVFWEKGYEGASLADLTTAMGISRSSMYAAFGDKAALFREVLTHYSVGPLAFIAKALELQSAREVITKLLEGTVDFLADSSHPRACITLHNLACSTEAEPIKQMMIKWRRAGEAAIQRRLQRARVEDDLPEHISPNELARYIQTIQTGLGVHAANGASRAHLIQIVEFVLRSLPI